MKIILYCLLLIGLLGCNNYELQPNCDLNALNIKGKVKKIETIVKSTTPLTELFYSTYNPSIIINFLDGNYVLEFNNHGNVCSYKGYGIIGEQLFDTKIDKEPQQKNIIPGLGGTSIENLEGLTLGKITMDSLQRIVEVEYNIKGKLSFISQIHYNEIGDPSFISKTYVFNIGFDDSLGVDFSFHDTTFYNYTAFDPLNNWTEVNVSYHGVKPKHNDSYSVKRQITYNDSTPAPPLIMQLSQYNQVETKPLSETRIDTIAGLGLLSIPHYMISDDETAQIIEEENNAKGIPQKNLCMYQYEGKDAYATISISDLPQEYASDYETLTEEEMEYDQETDEYIQELMSYSGVSIFKWLPYCFSSIGNKRTLCVQYYRHGQGSPIPVYVKSHEFKGSNGHEITITISYQSNRANRFHDDFEAFLNSIELY